MRTNIVLNDTLIEKGFALTGTRTKRALVNLALENLVQQHQNARKATIASTFNALRQLNDGQETPFPVISRHNRANPFADE